MAGARHITAVHLGAAGAASVNLRAGGASGPIIGEATTAGGQTIGVVFGGVLTTIADVYVELTGTANVYVYYV